MEFCFDVEHSLITKNETVKLKSVSRKLG